MKNRFLSLFLLILNLSVFSQDKVGYSEYTYKRIDTLDLKLFVKNPSKFKENKSYPVIIFFFGGGWNSGEIDQFRVHADYFSSRGMVSILANYRVRNRNNTTPFQAVEDAKTAIRFLRKNAASLHIDTSKIVASGGSAGGHLAAATATIQGLDSSTDDLGISPKPNALVLFNPVFDNGPKGYGYDRVKNRYLEISPLHSIRKGTPPTIVFLGTEDKYIPVETAKQYKLKMEESGCRCDLFLYEGQKHGFFNYRINSEVNNKYFIETVYQADIFLVSIGFLTGKPTINEFAQHNFK